MMSINYKIWQFCGFLKFNIPCRAVAFLIVPVITNILQVAFLIRNWRNIEIFALSAFTSVVVFSSIFRIATAIFNGGDYLKFNAIIENWFEDAKRQNDEIALKILNEMWESTERLSKTHLFVASIGAVGNAVVPLTFNQRAHPYAVWIPKIDVLQNPYFNIIYGLQVLFVIPFVIVTYIPFANIFMSWLKFGVAYLQILQNKFENLQYSEDNPGNTNIVLTEYIQKHNNLISFCNQINESFLLLHFIEYILFAFMLSVLLFVLVVVDDLMVLITVTTYIVCVFYACLLFYWHANELSFESLKISDAVYSCNWTSMSNYVKRNILLIMIRSQNPIQLSVGPIYPMSLETFQTILNASYSYYTLLKGVHQ